MDRKHLIAESDTYKFWCVHEGDLQGVIGEKKNA